MFAPRNLSVHECKERSASEIGSWSQQHLYYCYHFIIFYLFIEFFQAFGFDTCESHKYSSVSWCVPTACVWLGVRSQSCPPLPVLHSGPTLCSRKSPAWWPFLLYSQIGRGVWNVCVLGGGALFRKHLPSEKQKLSVNWVPTVSSILCALHYGLKNKRHDYTWRGVRG